jgi:hypothetical protein
MNRTTLALVCVSFGSTSLAQVNGIQKLPPARLAIEGNAAPTRSNTQSVRVRLLNADGKPVNADENIHFKVAADNASVVHEVTIPKGSDSATVNVAKTKPGVSKIQFEQTSALNPSLNASTQVSFTEDYTPKPPYQISFDISPSSKLKASVESADIIARVIDSERREVPAPRKFTINFPELLHRVTVTPAQLTISQGDSYAVANVTSNVAVLLPFRPSVNPPLSLLNNATNLEFVSPVVSAVVIPRNRYVEAIWPRKVDLAVGLTDARGNWIAADEDKTIVLNGDPGDVAIFDDIEVHLKRGESVTHTTLTPLREGKLNLIAVAGGLQNPSINFQFKYWEPFFWSLAAIGGFCGGIVRKVLAKQSKFSDLWIGAAVGLFVGVLTYVLAPALDFKSLDPALQGTSKLFHAFLYGFGGGAIGFAIFNPLLQKFSGGN